MRCKSCDAILGDHTSRKRWDAGLCDTCYPHSQQAVLDYEYGLTVNAEPAPEYSHRWESKYVLRNNPDSDEALDPTTL
jgi:hypothetical protein